ncbi:hypothetical protein AKJ09_09793 [Labilithrix luteola]|uniref:YbjN domain-containing protein n=1 Tax=Labilithrix luteola TaxID=1391654 RepID=A0A0K1QCH2_9BACT|nr:hypothetical protein AKJ09_09793 [Labilithrix luteola]
MKAVPAKAAKAKPAKAPVAKPAKTAKAKPAKAPVAKPAKTAKAKPAKAAKAKPAGSQGLDVVRAVFDELGWTYKVTTDADGASEIFVNTRGTNVFAGVKAIHYPGRFIVFGAAPFSVPAKFLGEAYKFVSHVNNALQDGCLMVREPGPAEVTFRAAVNYTRVSGLEPGLVTGVIADLVEGASATFAGLSQVAKGTSADKAFAAL